LEDANLSGADLSSANLFDADLTNANLINVEIKPMMLEQVLFCNTIMPDGSISTHHCE